MEVTWGWALILTFSAFRMGGYSRLGAYSNKYGMRANNYGELRVKTETVSLTHQS